MSSLRPRERWLIGGALVFGLAAATWYWVLPMYYRYGDLQQEIQENVKKIRNAQTQASRLTQLVKQLKETKRELKSTKRKLPRQGQFNQLMFTLEQKAMNTGIASRKIVTFNRGGVSEIKNGLLREMTIRTRFTGITLGQFTDLLWRYNNMTRLVNVKNFQTNNLRPVTDGPGIKFDLDLTLAVYMLHGEEGTTA